MEALPPPINSLVQSHLITNSLKLFWCPRPIGIPTCWALAIGAISLSRASLRLTFLILQFTLVCRYDVYDGQQRLVTLNLLLASLRDAFQREAGELNSGSHGGGKRGVALAATAAEIAGMLRPTKVRKEDVMRITLRRRDNVLLERILVGESARGGGDDEGDDEHPDMPPAKTFAKLSPKGKSKLLSSLSPANERIFQNFVHLSNRLDLLTTRERLQLLDYVVERVYLLVCIPETSRIARNIVMSQGRKGMDNEPVDDFKGLVCFRYTLEEEDMYQTFDQWDTLAAQPSASSSEDQEGSGIKSVGRDVISAACILRASASLRAKIRSRGGDEVYEWERWLRNELWLQNQKQPSKELFQGKDFFANSIEPASIALYKFRTRQWDEFNFLSKTRKMTKKQRDTIVARLNFLLDITSGVASAKEAEIATLELLLRAGDEEESNAMVSRYLNEILPLVEKWTLWMAVARPSPMQRHSRVFALLDAMDDVDSLGSTDDSEMANSLIESIDKYQFGASASGKRLAAAIMKRINSHLLVEGKKNTPASDGSATVELIQQTQWNNDEEEEEWANRIGNLALVSTSPRRKANAKSDAHSWQSKCDRYSKEKWLTTRLLGVFEQWNADTLQDQQKELLSLIEMVWDLGSRS
ncbi:hypothetical protein ACHAWF_010573 [Thalassiosira exigua]